MNGEHGSCHIGKQLAERLLLSWSCQRFNWRLDIPSAQRESCFLALSLRSSQLIHDRSGTYPSPRRVVGYVRSEGSGYRVEGRVRGGLAGARLAEDDLYPLPRETRDLTKARWSRESSRCPASTASARSGSAAAAPLVATEDSGLDEVRLDGQ